MMKRLFLLALTISLLGGPAACTKKPPVAGPTAAPAPFPSAPASQPTPTPAVRDLPPPPPIIPDEPVVSARDALLTTDIETINQNSPLRPVFFALDSDAIDDAARKIMADNAAVLKKYPSWAITIEGHCDERGTAEYNLALGDRRALAARNYLVSLGIAADRIRTVSYGGEFPFNPGHDEAAWAENRRAHFMLTSK